MDQAEIDKRAAHTVAIAKKYHPQLKGVELMVAALETDICDRRGLKSEWGLIEEDIIENDIKPQWAAIIREVIAGMVDKAIKEQLRG